MIKKYKWGLEARQLIYLTLIQGGNALLPLAIIPYLYLNLDQSDFARTFSVEAWILAFTPFVLYSFELTPVSNITDRCSKEKISIYIQKVLIVRSILYVGMVCFALIVSCIIGFSDFLLLSIWLIYPLGVMLQLNGVFLSVQRNDILALAVLIGKTFLIVSIFIIYRDTLNLYVVSLILVCSQLIQGVIAVYWLNLRFNIFKIKVVISDVFQLMKNDFTVAMGYSFIPLFRGGPTLILTVVGTSDAISFFIVVEKLAKAIQAVLRPLNQIQFRRLAIAVGRAGGGNNIGSIMLKYIFPQIVLIFVCSIVGYLFISLTDSELLSGPRKYVLIIMNLAIVFGICNFIISQGYLNFIGRRREFLLSVFFTGIASVTLGFAIIPELQSLGAAIAFLSGEALLLTFCAVRSRLK